MAQHWAYRFIPTGYLDWAAGLAVCDGEGETAPAVPVTVPPRAPLAVVLAALPPHVSRLYLCGERPGGGRSSGLTEWCFAAVGEDWASGAYDSESVVFVLHARGGEREAGRRVDLRHIEAWFGERTCSPWLAREALHTVRAIVRSTRTYERAQLMTTPGLTGTVLWQLLRDPRDYPPLPEEIQRIIDAGGGQGRIQLCAPPELAEAPGFFYLDGRFMYAALTQGMGVGLLAHDELPEFAEYRPARYRVRFTVPAGWQHLGLLPVLAGAEEGEYGETRRRWRYPDTPGETAETWADGSEVLLARRQGWDVRIAERVLFTTSRETRGEANRSDPLREWTEHLTGARAAIEDAAARGELRPELAALAGAAVRNILLHGIGNFAARGRKRTEAYAAGQPLPDETIGVPVRRHGTWFVTVEQPLSPWNAARRHPEWAAHIWARARCRTMHHGPKGEQPTGALTVPRDRVLGIRTDALYLAGDPGWPDTGRNGAFRLKGAIPRPIPAPRGWAAIDQLCDLAEAGLRGEG